MLGTGPMVAPDSSFEPWLEPDRVLCLSMPGSVSEVRKPRPCLVLVGDVSTKEMVSSYVNVVVVVAVDRPFAQTAE